MSIELTPLGVACNLQCTYCYQTPMRDAGNVGNKTPYNFEKMFKALEEEGSDFSVFGGEPLLVPLPDLIRIWEFGLTRYGKNGVQTNGVLITPEHIEAFVKYNVHVGFSLDGPDELNDSRWAGTEHRTRETSEKSHSNLRQCIAAGVGTSVIITLYKGNATPEKLPRLKEWIRQLDTMGVRGVRIHVLEVDHAIVRERMQLSEDQAIAALLELVALESTLPKLRFDILTDMRKLLRAEDDSVTCIWNPCDPYTTSAVRGVDGQGEKANCGRTNKDGILRVKAETAGYERQLALYNTPQEFGGCKGCRFFLMCKGQCPGTAIDGDWRNRSADCKLWMKLFELLETEMLTAGEKPLSLNFDERVKLEKEMIQVWGRGEHVSLKYALSRIREGKPVRGSKLINQAHGDSAHGDGHGDHFDHADGSQHSDKGSVVEPNRPHGDIPHGDHTDQNAK